MTNTTDQSGAKSRKFWKKFKTIVFGGNIFQVFLRIYLLVIIISSVLLYSTATHSSWIKDGTSGEHKYTYWDALFVSCSAFSDTGLTTVNLSTFYNFFGQFIVFVDIGLGGIGIISLFFIVWNWFKRDDEVKLNQLILLQSERGTNKYSDSFKSIRFCVLFIIITELVIGFLMSLWICFYPVYVPDPSSLSGPITWDSDITISAYHNYGNALWQGMFCSVSSMNNAGFDIFDSNCSLAAFRNDWNIIFQLMTMLEIFLGGIGYPLIFDVYEKIKHKKAGLKYRFSLFTKICLIAYFAVFFIGLGSAYGFEYGCKTSETLMGISNDNHAWGNNEWFNKNFAIIYNTVATRSAGFSTFNQNLLTTGTQLDFSILMIIGASPSSTGGGIRTSTLAIMIIAIWQLIRRKESVVAFKRTIPNRTVISSFIVTFTGIILVLLSSVVIYYTTSIDGARIASTHTFLQVFYETSSAFGTVGLSMGISAIASPVALFILVLNMFIGQLGISSTLLAWAKPKNATKAIKYSQEDVKIG